MATPPPYDLVVLRPLEPVVESLAGKRTGFREVCGQLVLDPCNLGAPHNRDSPKAYRLSGPLQPIVCGTHLRNGYRLAYTIQQPATEDERPAVVILYIGEKDSPTYGPGNDMWDVVHDLFGADNPMVGHLKPPCCDSDMPEIDDETLDAFIAALRATDAR